MSANKGILISRRLPLRHSDKHKDRGLRGQARLLRLPLKGGVIFLDSQLFWELNVEYIQKNKGDLMSKIPDT